jgi:hypothetical protein
MQESVAMLVREAATLDAVADALGTAASVLIDLGNRAGGRRLRRMGRDQRVKALMRRAQAASLLGRELPAAEATGL